MAFSAEDIDDGLRVLFFVGAKNGGQGFLGKDASVKTLGRVLANVAVVAVVVKSFSEIALEMA